MDNPYLGMMLLSREGNRGLPNTTAGLDKSSGSGNPFAQGMLQGQAIVNNANTIKINQLKYKQLQAQQQQEQTMEAGLKAASSGNADALKAWKTANPEMVPVLNQTLLQQSTDMINAQVKLDTALVGRYPTLAAYTKAWGNGAIQKVAPGAPDPSAFANENEYEQFGHTNLTLNETMKYSHNRVLQDAASLQSGQLTGPQAEAVRQDMADQHTLTQEAALQKHTAGKVALLNAASNRMRASAALTNAGTKAGTGKAPTDPTPSGYSDALGLLMANPAFNGLSRDKPGLRGTGQLSFAAAWANTQAHSLMQGPSHPVYNAAFNQVLKTLPDHIMVPTSIVNGKPTYGSTQTFNSSPSPYTNAQLLSDPSIFNSYITKYHALPLPVVEALQSAMRGQGAQ